MPRKGHSNYLGLNNRAIDYLEATDDEVEYLQRLRILQSRQRDCQTNEQNDRIPTVIINDFLYHGAHEHLQDLNILEQLGIEHIINVSNMPLSKDILDKYNVLSIELEDYYRANIRLYFDQTNEFLRECQKKKEKVLVYCYRGISRSSSIILAYLLRYHHDTLHNAYRCLLEQRCMSIPNDGFLLTLIRYEKELSATRSIDGEETSRC